MRTTTSMRRAPRPVRIAVPLLAAALALAVVLVSGSAFAYPGGTPDYQTDVTPFCASCHSSIDEKALSGTDPEKAKAQVLTNKHFAAILAGKRPYDQIPEAERGKVVELLQALDKASTITIEYPTQVKAGQTFDLTVKVTGGAGPAVGIALVDRPHRWFAKPITTVGWEVVGAPTIIGPDGDRQTGWINRRPESDGRNITFVNATGIDSDAGAGKFSRAKVVWTLKAPSAPGSYSLYGAYFYGTEKGVAATTQIHPVYGETPLGGFGGASGRVKFSDEAVIIVNPE